MTKTATKCSTCNRDPARMNNEWAECSHPDCTHRRKAWSERPSPASLFKGPWPKNEDEDPAPIDSELKRGAA